MASYSQIAQRAIVGNARATNPQANNPPQDVVEEDEVEEEGVEVGLGDAWGDAIIPQPVEASPAETEPPQEECLPECPPEFPEEEVERLSPINEGEEGDAAAAFGQDAAALPNGWPQGWTVPPGWPPCAVGFPPGYPPAPMMPPYAVGGYPAPEPVGASEPTGPLPMEMTPCRFHFGSSGPCRYGDMCFFSHDPAVYMEYHGLHFCPNEDCGQMCRGKQCKECHDKMVETKENHLCEADGCDALSRLRFCKPCYDKRKSADKPRRANTSRQNTSRQKSRGKPRPTE